MYNVVLRNIIKNALEGAVTWTSLEDKEDFDDWYDEDMKKRYEVIEEGVTEKRVMEICSSPEATTANLLAILRRVDSLLK